MGNPKQKWTSEEEDALRAGVAKHGPGKWKNIQKDPEFNHLLYSRSNIDLKDKWRNLSVASGLLPRDKLKLPPKLKFEPPATPLLITPPFSSVPTSSLDSSMAIVTVDSSKPVPEANNTSKYNEMIYEAISTLKDPTGSDCSTIASFIEQRQQQVPPNFRRLISSRIRRLVQQDKLDKMAENRYKIKGGAPLDAKGPAIMKQKDPLPQKDPQPQPRPHPQPQPKLQPQPQPQPHQQPKPPVMGIGYVGDTVEEAAGDAARKIADAENKSLMAAEAVKEAERVAAIAEEMDALLQFAIECYEKTEHGDIVLNF